MDFENRFFAKVIPEPNSGCWLWLGPINNWGYGRAFRNGKAGMAHRISYEMARGEIGPGLQIDHLCRVRCCVNPDHLEPVTPQENSLRSIAARFRDGSSAPMLSESRCRHGHNLDEVGRYRRPNGELRCMECARISRRRQYGPAQRAAARAA